MAVQTGLNSFIGSGVESTWGTKVAMSVYNRFVRQTIIPAADMTAGNRSLGRPFAGGKRRYAMRSEGEIEFDLRYQGFERWLKALFGTCTSTAETGADTDAYNHVFVMNATRPVGLTLDINTDSLMFPVPGFKVNKGTLNMGLGVASLVVGGVAKAYETAGSRDTPTYAEDTNTAATDVNNIESGYAGSPDTALNGFSFQVGDGVTAGAIGTPTALAIKEPVSVNIEAPIDASRINMGDPNIAEPILSGQFAITGSIKRELISDAMLDYWLAGNALYFRFQYDGPGPIKAGGTLPYRFRVDIPYAMIQSAMGPIANAGAIEEDIPWESTPPTGAAADGITLTLWNKLTAVT